MIALIAISVALVISLVALYFSVSVNLKLGRIVLAFEDQVEESLDVLDESYQHIAEIAAMPVMSDEPIIRNVMFNIKQARDAVLVVANKLVAFEPAKSRDDNDDDNTTTTG